MCADDLSNTASGETTSTRDVPNHRPIDMEDESLCEDETLLRVEPGVDNLVGRQPPASNRHTGRDGDRGYENNEPSTSVASSVGTATTEDNTANVAQVHGQIHHARTLQAFIEIRVIPRYTNVEVCPNDQRALYADCVVRVVEDGFKEALQLKQD